MIPSPQLGNLFLQLVHWSSWRYLGIPAVITDKIIPIILVEFTDSHSFHKIMSIHLPVYLMIHSFNPHPSSDWDPGA